MLVRSIAFFIAGALTGFTTLAESQVATPDFEVGQRWSYQTRPQEPESTLVVGRVENDPKLGSIVHVSVVGLRLKNPRADGGFGDIAAHLPISPKALRDSVISHIGESEPAAEAKGGVFTVSVREAVQFVEDALARGK